MAFIHEFRFGDHAGGFRVRAGQSNTRAGMVRPARVPPAVAEMTSLRRIAFIIERAL